MPAHEGCGWRDCPSGQPYSAPFPADTWPSPQMPGRVPRQLKLRIATGTNPAPSAGSCPAGSAHEGCGWQDCPYVRPDRAPLPADTWPSPQMPGRVPRQLKLSSATVPVIPWLQSGLPDLGLGWRIPRLRPAMRPTIFFQVPAFLNLASPSEPRHPFARFSPQHASPHPILPRS
jgi:hypothetical protein